MSSTTSTAATAGNTGARGNTGAKNNSFFSGVADAALGLFGSKNSNNSTTNKAPIQTITSNEASNELKRQENASMNVSSKGGRRRSNTKKSRKNRKTRKARKSRR